MIIMPFDWSKEWDKRDKIKSGKPIEELTREKKIKIYGGLTILSMAFFLALLVFF